MSLRNLVLVAALAQSTNMLAFEPIRSHPMDVIPEDWKREKRRKRKSQTKARKKSRKSR